MPRRDSTYASSVASEDLSDYDVISSGGLRSLESSVDDLKRGEAGVQEPPPAQAAREKLATATLTAEDVQTYVQTTLDRAGVSGRSEVAGRRTVRIYVDGAFDGFHAGHALQLRQAKLSFPSVRLLVGVLPDSPGSVGIPHVERSELVRHCRWVDEVISDAPPVLDEQFLLRHRIDFVAVEEGIALDPTCEKVRVKGYEHLRELGKVIPTRRTFGLTPHALSVANPSTPVPPPAIPPPSVLSGLPTPVEPVLDVEAVHGTPRSPLQMFEEGPPIDIYGIGI